MVRETEHTDACKLVNKRSTSNHFKGSWNKTELCGAATVDLRNV